MEKVIPRFNLVFAMALMLSCFHVQGQTQLNIYPNPSTDKINIKVEFEEKQDKVAISIKDITGKTILVQNDYKVSNRQYSFNLNEQNSGMYFIEIKTESGMKSKKFVLHQSG